MPTVVNRHHFAYVEGVGAPPLKKPRKGKNYLPQPWIYVGRPSPLGNPFRFAAGETHELILEQYRRWLWDRLRRCDWNNPRDYLTLLAMNSIGPDTNLVCSCAPRPCHADIVHRAWLWLQSRKAA